MSFYARPVVDVARDLIGRTLRLGETAGVIVETEAYHESEPSCHAHIGRTARAEVLFAKPGTVYVYRSYGIHSLVNIVVEKEDVGAAVLIRALEPSHGVELMSERRGTDDLRNLCSGPGKLTQALGIELELNRTTLKNGPLAIDLGPGDVSPNQIVASPRIGISKAVEMEWRFSVRDSKFVSRPLPKH